MFHNRLEHIFSPLKKLYEITGLILVGSDVESWKGILEDTKFESIYYVDTYQINYKTRVFPCNWNVSMKLLAKKDGEIEYFNLTNPYLSGIYSHEYFQKLWKNVATKSVEQKEAITIKTFLEQNALVDSSLMLVVDSFDGKNIVQNIEELNIPVIVLRMLKSEQDDYECLMNKQGYLCIDIHEDNHPELQYTVYVRNYKQQGLQKELEKEKNQKANLQKELEKQHLKSCSEYRSISIKDTNIESFIQDIEPFFYKKSLSYVDVGAYTGEVFLKFKQGLQIREAHLFEPNPVSYNTLMDNVGSLNLPILNIHNIALGSKTDSKVTFISANSMTKKVSDNPRDLNQEKYFEVEVQTLKKFEGHFTDKHINLLKIDVEGTELDVLEGSKELLENHLVDILYIEVGFNKSGTQQTYFGDIDLFMQNYNYRVYKIYEQVNEWIDDSPLLRRCNFAYMSESFAKGNSLQLVYENFELKNQLDKYKKGLI